MFPYGFQREQLCCKIEFAPNVPECTRMYRECTTECTKWVCPFSKPYFPQRLQERPRAAKRPQICFTKIVAQGFSSKLQSRRLVWSTRVMHLCRPSHDGRPADYHIMVKLCGSFPPRPVTPAHPFTLSLRDPTHIPSQPASPAPPQPAHKNVIKN